jgi:hypothetical protein
MEGLIEIWISLKYDSTIYDPSQKQQTGTLQSSRAVTDIHARQMWVRTKYRINLRRTYYFRYNCHVLMHTPAAVLAIDENDHLESNLKRNSESNVCHKL